MQKDFHNMHYFCVGIRKYKYILYLLLSKQPVMFLICCGMLEIESIYLDKIEICACHKHFEGKCNFIVR